MKRKHLFMAMAALLAAGGLWFALTPSRPDQYASDKASLEQKSKMDVGLKTPDGQPKPGKTIEQPARLAPPDPSRRFTDFTPEQRVEFARKGHGPGG